MRTSALWVFSTATQAAVFQVLWTTDADIHRQNYVSNTFGPDGPWQAIDVDVGNIEDPRPMWPSGAETTMASEKLDGFPNNIADSTTAIQVNASMSRNDDWLSFVFSDDDTNAEGVVDTVSVVPKAGGDRLTVNTTLLSVSKWDVPFGANSKYSARVGILGLGPRYTRRLGSATFPVGILPELKSRGDIPSLSFGLHMGSVAFKQRGSLVLGGHERNRALGTVGVFRYDEPRLAPLLLLVDVFLGTHIGRSPFEPPISERTSVWRGAGNSTEAEELTSRLGGKAGFASVMINPAVPYIYLPPGTCEAAAEHLPVTFSPRLNLFLWDTASAAYGRIVNSPAYLAFVFADRTATNVTIKVPFHLLNLTLEKPLVDTPTQYFPCKPHAHREDLYGFWMLGRAFLQAAFFGVDYERNLTYLAQAPGPDMEQSVLVERPAGQEGLETNPIEEWESSWIKRWKVLATEGDSGESLTEQKGSNAGMGVGATVGLVMGVLAFVIAVGVGGWFWWKRKRGKTGMTPVPGKEEPKEEWARGYQGFAEADGTDKPRGYWGLSEADGSDRPIEVPSERMVFEMEAPHVRHEVPGNGEFRGEGGHISTGKRP